MCKRSLVEMKKDKRETALTSIKERVKRRNYAIEERYRSVGNKHRKEG